MEYLRDKSSWILWKSKSKEKKLTPSLRETYNLFLKKNSIQEIAKIKKVKIETIEIQMIDLISKSLIWIEDVIEKDIFNNILDIIDDENISSLKKIKDKLGPSINYFQIKCVLAYISSMPDKLE